MGSGAGRFLKVVANNFVVLSGMWSVLFILSTPQLEQLRPAMAYILGSVFHDYSLRAYLFQTHRMAPFWSYAKLIVTCWLVIPYFSGAAYVYELYVRPFFLNRQTINIWYVPRKDIFRKPDDILTAAEKYIEENGPEAFEKLIHRCGDREADSMSSNYIFSGKDYRY